MRLEVSQASHGRASSAPCLLNKEAQCQANPEFPDAVRHVQGDMARNNSTGGVTATVIQTQFPIGQIIVKMFFNTFRSEG